jgi:hypothetical protein
MQLYFLGACELAEQTWVGLLALKRAFDVPLSYSAIHGNEEKLTNRNGSTEIKLLSNSCTNQKPQHKVLTKMKNAVTKLKLVSSYIYAEILSNRNNANQWEGTCSLTTVWRFIVWASKIKTVFQSQ